MKCSCCGEEVGKAKICPICETPIVKKTQTNSNHLPSPFVNNDNIPEMQPKSSILKQIAQEKTRMVEECSKAVCVVYAYIGDNYCAKGTGWCGYGNYIITNAHVVNSTVNEGENPITCEFPEKLNLGREEKIYADLIYMSEEKDIAILLPRGGKLPVGVKILQIEDKPTKQGELVFTVGNPEHYKFTYTEGSVANPDYKSPILPYTVLQTTLTLNHGNSGGPVMNADGHVVGMATFAEINAETHRCISGYGFCVKSEDILAAIKEEKIIRR